MKLAKTFREMWQSCEYSVAYERMETGQTKIGLIGRVRDWYDTLTLMLEWMSSEVECYKYGHDLVDCSYVGPDSGDADHYCDRCGRYWSVPLY